MKYKISSIYSTENKIKITTAQTGSKAMIREAGQDKATLRLGFRVMADNKTLMCGEWNKSERELLLDVIKYERYARLTYEELYYDLLGKLESIGFSQKSDSEDDCRF